MTRARPRKGVGGGKSPCLKNLPEIPSARLEPVTCAEKKNRNGKLGATYASPHQTQRGLNGDRLGDSAVGGMAVHQLFGPQAGSRCNGEFFGQLQRALRGRSERDRFRSDGGHRLEGDRRTDECFRRRCTLCDLPASTRQADGDRKDRCRAWRGWRARKG